MAEQNEILVIAASARALACSASAAGFAVHAFDLFADTDTAEHCLSCTRVAGTLSGFDSEDLLRALDRVDPAARLDVVFASVIDTQYQLLSRIGQRRRVLGASPAQLARLAHPAWRRRWLRSLGVTHPDTRLSRPPVSDGWIRKRRLASGGFHIESATDESVAGDDARSFYYQRLQVGMSVSATVLASAQTLRIIGFAEQTPRISENSFRFAGARSLRSGDWPQRFRQSVQRCVERLNGNIPISGLLSLDFVVGEHGCALLEINARPSANFELFDVGGALLRLHLEACRHQSRPIGDAVFHQLIPPDENRQRLIRAFAVVYAGQPVLVDAAIDWPPWVRDRAAAGTAIQTGEPLCSIYAQHHSLDGLKKLLAQRQSSFSRRLYESGSSGD